MNVPKFDPRELIPVRYNPNFRGGPGTPIFNTPVTMKENARLMFAEKKPVWMGLEFSLDFSLFCPAVHPDNVARASVFDGTMVFGKTNTTGGRDMFGIEWEYVPSAGGSMVRPGKPYIEDANELITDKIVWPDIDSWDWEGSAKANEKYLESDRFMMCWMLNGWYERLISLMDFEGAVTAMIDEEQTEAVKAFFDRLSDLYIKIIDRYLTYFPQIDGFYIHDDWGSQRETFFSPDVVEEMIVPYMRRVTDFIHANGRYCELHSCGQIARQVPNIVKAGWDAWGPQVSHDVERLYEEYGDKLIFCFNPPAFDPKTASEEEQRISARTFVEKFSEPGKPVMVNHNSGSLLTPVFLEELYKQSRIKYGG